MAFLRPGSKSKGAFGIAYDVDRDTDAAPVFAAAAEGNNARFQRSRLPVHRFRDAILNLVETHATTIIVGETGSGKTTQIPQYLHENGWTADGYQVVCTQPRRVAAMSVAARVAEEMGCGLGQDVGYAIRFEDVSTPGRTRVKFVTDGVLIREMMDDPLLSSYSVVMVDEAHERSISTDMLLGLLKKVQRQRPQLRLIISSATLEAQKFADFFNTSSRRHNGEAMAAGVMASVPSRTPALLTVEGRRHDVTIHYAEQPVSDYVKCSVETAVAIHKEDMPGDILVFLTGQEECEDCVAMLNEESRRLQHSRLSLRLLAVPLYAGLSAAGQQQALSAAPRGYRKVVVATNVAETSVTIEGVVYVIDSCFSKQRVYNPLAGLESLLVAPISKASATQRAGRAGRTAPGHCYRLCTEDSWHAVLREIDVPEMQRSELSNSVLTLKALGVHNVMRFDFIAPPPAESMIRAMELLYALKAIDDDARLTDEVGIKAAEMPLHPMLSAVLLASLRYGCAEECITIAACLSVQSVWSSAVVGRHAMDAAKQKFAVAEGDLITYLNVYRAWNENNRSLKWCIANCVHGKSMMRAEDIRMQLRAALMRAARVSSLPSCARDDVDAVRRALTAGMFFNAARYDRTEYNPLKPAEHGVHVYQLIRRTGVGSEVGVKLRIHPSSVLFRTQPKWLLYWSIQQSGGGCYDMQDIVTVQPQWLLDAAPDMYHMQ